MHSNSVTSADRQEDNRATVAAALVIALTFLPYLIASTFAFGRKFTWLGYNLDDSCVYLSWMRQAEFGATRAYNLFTTDPQHGMMLNPLFLVLGRLAAVMHAPLFSVYQGARLTLGFCLLMVVWRFIRLTVAQPTARRFAFLCVCFSSGLGWLPLWWHQNAIQTPIDKWQPEAITFLSLYLSPLFAASMALQVGTILLLLNGKRSGRVRYAVGAGVCALLLALIHTYDVVTMSAIWFVYLLVESYMSRHNGIEPAALWKPWAHAILAGCIALPGVLYIFYEFQIETVFRQRANVATMSPSFCWLLAGYGVTLLLAVYGANAALRGRAGASERTASSTEPTKESWTTGSDAARLLVVWAVVNVAVSYAPHLAFQRKLLQGAHIPIALLAGIGVTLLFEAVSPLRRMRFGWKAALITLLLFPTNARFIYRDIGNWITNRSQNIASRSFLLEGEVNALRQLNEMRLGDAAVQPLPWAAISGGHIGAYDHSLAVFMPCLTGRHVYCGHWGETPDFGRKLNDLVRIEGANTPDPLRAQILIRTGVRYLIFSQKQVPDTNADQAAPIFRGKAPLPSYLTRIYTNSDADIYQVNANVIGAAEQR